MCLSSPQPQPQSRVGQIQIEHRIRTDQRTYVELLSELLGERRGHADPALTAGRREVSLARLAPGRGEAYRENISSAFAASADRNWSNNRVEKGHAPWLRTVILKLPPQGVSWLDCVRVVVGWGKRTLMCGDRKIGRRGGDCASHDMPVRLGLGERV